MVQLAQTYTVSELPTGDFDPIPAGAYPAIIVNSEMKDSSTGGKYLELEINISGDNYNGRKLFERLNLENQNPTAVQIAFQTLGKICTAIGIDQVGDSVQLHNIPFIIDIDIEKGKPYIKDGVEKEGNDQNRIKKYSSAGIAAPVTPQPAPQTAAVPTQSPAAPASASDAPWER